MCGALARTPCTFSQASRLGDCRIEAFLDSNPHYAGATLVGRPVIEPSGLQAADAASPRVFCGQPVDHCRCRPRSVRAGRALILLY